MAAAGSGRSMRASALSASSSASQVWPVSSTRTPWRVRVFIGWAMTVCSSACGASSLGACTATNTGMPSSPHGYT
ncbi:MAG: hypothetical protein ACK540_08700, partial [Betaproteobacteria bacterium]